MSVAYLTDRCTATCWRGDPQSSLAGKARCKISAHTPHEVHKDENGNSFIVDKRGVAHVVDVHGRWLN